jgi:hypothetical protein
LVSCAYCACIVRQNPVLVSSRCLKAETLTRLSAEMGKREDGGIVLRETNHRNGSALLFYAEGCTLPGTCSWRYATAFAASISSVYLPNRALLLHQAR